MPSGVELIWLAGGGELLAWPGSFCPFRTDLRGTWYSRAFLYRIVSRYFIYHGIESTVFLRSAVSCHPQISLSVVRLLLVFGGFTSQIFQSNYRLNPVSQKQTFWISHKVFCRPGALAFAQWTVSRHWQECCITQCWLFVIICTTAVAYSMGQIINSVCLCSCVCLSGALSRLYFLIDFAKRVTELTTPKNNKKASIRWQDSAPPISGDWPTSEPNAG